MSTSRTTTTNANCNLVCGSTPQRLRAYSPLTLLALGLWTPGCVASIDDVGAPAEAAEARALSREDEPRITELNASLGNSVLVRASSGEMRLWAMNGNTVTGSETIANPGSVPIEWQTQGIGDFDNSDGDDILWRNTATSEVSLWLKSTTPPYVAISLAGPGVVEAAWQVAGVGDFDGDGTSDIVWRHTNGEVKVWLMRGGAIASQLTVSGPGVVELAWQIQGVGDFDADGKSDLLWRNLSTSEVKIWLMNGGTRAADLQVTAPGVVGFEWQIQGVGDFNRDGHSDMLWRNSNGEIKVWLMSGHVRMVDASVSAPGEVGSEWVIRGLGDFNFDSRTDLLWRNLNTGEAKVWYMYGANTPIHSPGVTSTVTDVGPSWQIEGICSFPVFL